MAALDAGRRTGYSRGMQKRSDMNRSEPVFREWSWILTLFGTAVGAGILYLPLQVGVLNIWALVFLTVLIFPLIHYSHQTILRLLLSESPDMDYPGIVAHHFGRWVGGAAVGVYFLTFYAVLCSYSVGLNANLGDVLHETGVTAGNWAHGPYLSLGVLAVLAGLHVVGTRLLLRVMSVISFGLIVLLGGISIYLIPFWDAAVFRQALSWGEFLDDVLLILPLLVFSFVFFPAMSSMAAAGRNLDADESRVWRHLNRTILKTTGLLLLFVLFFVYSCILALTPEEFERAIQENLNCLALLSHKEEIPPVLIGLGSAVGLAALVTSFIGVCFAARESARRLVDHVVEHAVTDPEKIRYFQAHRRGIDIGILMLLFSSLWVLTLANPSVIQLFGLLISPLVAMFLFIVPVAVLVWRDGVWVLRRPVLAVVLMTGLLLLFSFRLGTWLKVWLDG